ncbi:hypothetical protein PP939_gp093 [Rhizobium phage RL38J1]|uniref:DUF7831 domain-containing protein n=1 Tax=Rhizobium phage RL38J1 TaxID=2663232 RepID=A0A6B9J1G5_9CAUD|nr:hypothetical protein PP939_gp093 [Rhizobium phage RL38J1]QGZ13940.1 hypothetical protein RL38J1_093 [Rhizobium phage RL38J1]
MPIAYCHEEYTIDLLDSKFNSWFVFGDNMTRRGYSGQSVIRDCRNAIGVVTKYLPSKSSFAFITDRDLDQILPVIVTDLSKIENKLQRGEMVYWPVKGIGTGRANLKQCAPRLFAYIIEKRDHFFRTYPKLDDEKFHNLF